MQAEPQVRHLLLVGGGHSHVILLRMLAMKPLPGLRVTLISESRETPYSGMLPGVIAGHYDRDEIHIDLGKLCRFAGVTLIAARVTGLDTDAKRVSIAGRPSMTFDVLSLDMGSTPDLSVPGASEYAVPVKPISSFLSRWAEAMEAIRAGHVKHIAVVGAGAGGVEIALAINHWVAQNITDKPLLHLYFGSEQVLEEYPDKVRSLVTRQLTTTGVRLHPGTRVKSVAVDRLTLHDESAWEADLVFWVTGASAQGWLADSGLTLNEAGFIAVEATLQSVSHPDIFAAGDNAHMTATPRPKAGVYAVRQGPYLHRNILAWLQQQPLRAYVPQDNFLSLLSLGPKQAVGSRTPLTIQGRWVWQLKNYIDRQFMARFQKLPDMPAARPAGLLTQLDQQMQCGGCGSKVSAGLLEEVLTDLGIDTEKGDDAAIWQPSPGKVMLHTVDGFRSFTDDAWLFARIAVNHALSDIYAMGATPVTALALVTTPLGRPALTKMLLSQMMSGAALQLSDAGVELVGGHTTEGPEMYLAFAINGQGEAAALMTKGGLQPGDQLILTKPVGTG
ncbi:MAG: selenide, water dikinase SelD, partial [Pseudomonadales bacterium]|nr:selenide, water dikinase SelD [Pseudomonadales bacterium]